MYIPQCECNTANVQNKASVAGVVHMKGTITAGIWIKETNRSADHILVWSPLPCCRAGDVVRHCVGTKLFLGNLTFFCERICRLKPERHLECCLINVLANILIWSKHTIARPSFNIRTLEFVKLGILTNYDRFSGVTDNFWFWSKFFTDDFVYAMKGNENNCHENRVKFIK